MRYEGPTVPTPDRQALADPADPANPADAAARSEMPTWPVEAERRRRMHDAEHVRSGRMREAMFGLSLVGNVVLFASLLGVLALIQMSLFAQGGASRPPTTNFTLSSPSATMTASPSPSLDAAALQVTPSSVRLTCAGDQRAQVVTMQNSGAMTVQWRATFSSQKPGVTVSPQQGELAAGDSMSIQVQTTTKSTGPQGSSGRQGIISFAPTNLDSGQPAQLSYTTVGCH
jgi:hypothetical protein